MDSDSQIVIGPDGTVLAATGDVPPGIIDLHVDECEGLSPEIRGAGKALVQQLRGSRNRVRTESIAFDDGRRRVQLIAIEALVIRRAATDLRTILSSKLAVVSSQAAAAEVGLSVVVAAEVPALVYVDAEKLAWAVTTLVGNGLRYVQEGSRRISGGKISVRVAFDPPSSQVTIEVEDDGPGIPADTVTRLFRRDGLNVRGAGLALLMMSDICVAHGGTIDVRSSIGPEHGTTVRLTIPAPM